MLKDLVSLRLHMDDNLRINSSSKNVSKIDRTSSTVQAEVESSPLPSPFGTRSLPDVRSAENATDLHDDLFEDDSEDASNDNSEDNSKNNKDVLRSKSKDLKEALRIIKKTNPAIEALARTSAEPADGTNPPVFSPAMSDVRLKNEQHVSSDSTYSYAPYLAEKSSSFGVGTILKSKSQVFKHKAISDELLLGAVPKPSLQDTFRNRKLHLEPSGLVDTRKRLQIRERLESYSVPEDPAVAVVPSSRSCIKKQDQEEIYSETSVWIYCKVCRRFVQSRTSYKIGNWAYVSAACCILFPFLILCAWIPLVFTKFADVAHKCPECKTTLGHYKRI